MNAVRRCLLSSSLCNRLLQDKPSSIGLRFLYNDQFLGMDKYTEARQRTISRLGNMKENFYYRLTQQVGQSSGSMVFTEDLKTVIHTCEDKPEEIDLFLQMIKKFHKQNKELRFGTFVFGPVAMRLFYYLKKIDVMMESLKDPELEGFFDQLKSYLLCMDLYFKNGLYQECFDTFDVLQKKNVVDTKFPREALVLALGSCYKLNTPEMCEVAMDLVTQARGARVPIVRKALLFVCSLALDQEKADVALEILSSIDQMNNITGNNIKLMALAKLGRIEDAFDILRRVTDQDAPMQSKIRGEICQSCLDEVQKAVDSLDDKESSHKFEQLCRSLKESNYVTSQTIDELVSRPIEPRPFFREGGEFAFRERGRFPDQPFRSRERMMGDDNLDSDRRRRFAGLSDSY